MERRLAAILAADIVGFSRQMADDEESVLVSQADLHKQLIDPEIAQYGGRIFKTTGDGFLAEFSSVVDAVRAAVNIQLAVQENGESGDGSPDLVYRMGINLGDVVAEDGDIYGNGVNVAVRLEGLAEPGGICVSRTVVDHVQGKVVSGFAELGKKKLKNIPEPVELFRVEMQPEERLAIRPIEKNWSKPAVMASAILLVCVLAAIAWQRPWDSQTKPGSQPLSTVTGNEKPSIAVLPFANLSGNRSEDYFADGVTDDLISDLSRISGLFVISRNASFSFRGKAESIPEIARKLGVRYLLEGSIRRAGKKIRINTQLIDATSGGQVWAERYDQPEAALFKVHNQIIGKIAEMMSVRLTQSETERLKRQPTENLEAYDYYLRAENLGRDWEETERRGLELYHKATELDPGFADAFAGYARMAVNVWHYELNDVMPAGLARKRAYEAITQAAKLDDKNVRSLTVLSRLQLLDGYGDLAIATAKKSLTIGPNDVEAHLALASAYVTAGRHTEGLATINEAIRRNPDPPPYLKGALGWALFHSRRYEEAVLNLEAAKSAGVSYLRVLAMAYAQSNQIEKANLSVDQMLLHARRANVQLSRVRLAHFAKPEDLRHMIEALRKAGLPEWPFRFKVASERKLDGDGLVKISFGRAWQGSNLNVSPQFFQQIQDNGKYAYRDNLAIVTGEYSVDGDRLCQVSANFVMGRRQCGYVYRNLEGNPENRNEYTYVNTHSILTFSVSE